MLINIWTIIVLLCCLAVILHPTKHGVSIGCIFLLSILVPELLQKVGLVGKWYFSACILSIILSMCLLQGHYGENNLTHRLMNLFLFFEIPLNTIGIFIERYHWDIVVNDYLYYSTGVAPAVHWINDYQQENWLYLLFAIINYGIALYILIDKEGRKQNVGFGIFQLLGDQLLSAHLRFKDMVKWEK